MGYPETPHLRLRGVVAALDAGRAGGPAHELQVTGRGPCALDRTDHDPGEKRDGRAETDPGVQVRLHTHKRPAPDEIRVRSLALT